MSLSIKQKLMAAFAAVLVLSTVSILIGVFQLDRLDRTLQHITQDSFPALTRAQEMLSHTYVMEVETRNLVSAQDVAQARQAVTEFKRAHQELVKDLHGLYNGPAANEQSLNLIALDTGLTNYLVQFEDFKRQALAYQELKGAEGSPFEQVQRHDQLVRELMQEHSPAIDELQQHLTRFMEGTRQALEEDQHQSADWFLSVQNSMYALLGGAMIIGFGIALLVSRAVTRSLQLAQYQASQVVAGNLQAVVEYAADDEVGVLIRDLNHMTEVLQRLHAENEQRAWIDQNLARLHETARGEKGLAELSSLLLTTLGESLDAPLGTLYLRRDVDESGYPWIQPELQLLATRALSKEQVPASFRWGEGLVGQSAKEGNWLQLQEASPGYFTVASGLGAMPAPYLLVLPFWFGQEVRGVIELASVQPWSELKLELLERALKVVGIAVQAALNREELIESLKEAQAFTEELQTQQEELQSTNEELAAQSRALEVSQEELSERNFQLEQTQSALNTRAQQLQQASQYKSEFLANMSHELRTPLNSILLLSRSLVQGGGEGDAREHAQVIQDAGQDLLLMINDLLDLSRIEAGKMPISLSRIDLKEFVQSFQPLFQPQAEARGVRFQIVADGPLPELVESDRTRLQQVLRNFLSNAFKFTKSGEVTLRVEPVSESIISHLATYDSLQTHLRERPGEYVAFSVSDTGLGIPYNKFQLVFEAFRQADGSISREYGGTGLGLAISAQIAHLLEGALALQSSTDPETHGSTFSLVVPLQPSEALLAVADETDPHPAVPEERPAEEKPALPLMDDRQEEQAGVRTLLVVEDDPNEAQQALNLGRELGFRVLHASTGIEGLRLAEQHLPTMVVLSTEASVLNGWSMLRQLRKHDATSHIPVVLLSREDEEALGRRLGAVDFLRKPVPYETLRKVLVQVEERQQQPVKRLLVVGADEEEHRELHDLLECGKSLECEAVMRGAAAIEALRKQHFDACILDLSLPDLSGFEVLKQVREDPSIERVPIIVYTNKCLTLEEDRRLREEAQSIILKTADSPARLLEETTLFLHRSRSELSPRRQGMLQQLQQADAFFDGKKVLLADDDIRNTYALASLLKKKGFQVITAADGAEALKRAEEQASELSLILMDVMMPGMDGLEVIRRLRKQSPFGELPILALTAKSMKEDREECLAAGASDYLTKPIDQDQLLSLMRLWLSFRSPHGC